jgi:preprotein translocase subunit SecD
MFRGWWVFVVILLVAVALAFVRAGDESTLILKCEPLEKGGAVSEQDVAKAVEVLSQRVGEDGVVEEGLEQGTIRVRYREEEGSKRELQFLTGVGNLEMALIPKHFVPRAPGDKVWKRMWEDRRTGEEVGWKAIYEASEVLFTRDDLARNSQVQGSFSRDEWEVRFEIVDEEKAEFRQKTGANVGRVLALVLDGQPLMAPVIRSAIPGIGVMSGHFTQREAAMLSRVLNTEPLPVRLSVVETPATT